MKRERLILLVGWLGFLLYAYPGFMSFDSVYQLLEARSGEFGDAHPPLMGALWRIVDCVIAGPFGMLIIQSLCFLGGAYLLFKRFMRPQSAAICASLLLWMPPVAAVMAVIWKDSQMAGYLLLGTALLLSQRRPVKIVGLVLMVAATAMRHNALSMTFPLVVLLFTWRDDLKWWKRYPIAIATWVGIVLCAQLVSAALTVSTKKTYLWHDALAIYDITGTLRYADDIPDDELRKIMDGIRYIPQHDIQEATRRHYRPEDIVEKKRLAFGTGDYVTDLWTTTYNFIDVPQTMPERYAVARAWKSLVPTHLGAYLTYRWHVLVDRIQLHGDPIPSAAYVWFVDVLDPPGSATKIEHSAMPSRLQDLMREGMRWLGSSWLFRPYVYLLITLLLLPLWIRQRALMAIAVSGIAGEAALFFLAPTVDFRYSYWLVVSTVALVMMLIALRHDDS